MSWLDDLYASLGTHRGSWLGLPDLGVTEAIGASRGVQQNPVTGGTGLANIIAGRSNPAPVQPTYVPRQSTPTNQSVLGANSGFDTVLNRATNPTSGGGNPGATDGGSSGEDVARLAYNAALAQANALRERGRSTFNDLLASVSKFRDRSLDYKNTGEKEIFSNAANVLGSNAGTARDLAASANAQGRNLGLSSRINLGQKILGNLQGTQGSTLAARTQNLDENRNLYNTRIDQADAKEAEANQYLKSVEDAASNVAAGGLSDYSGALQNIVDRANALAAVNPLNSAGLSAFTPNLSGITNTLNGIISNNAGPVTPGATDQGGNLYVDPTLTAYLKRLGTYQY